MECMITFSKTMSSSEMKKYIKICLVFLINSAQLESEKIRAREFEWFRKTTDGCIG